MDSAYILAVVGIGGTLVASISTVAVQNWSTRRQALDERLWAERMAVYVEAGLVAERLDTRAYNLTKPLVMGEPQEVDKLPEASTTRAVSARIEVVASAKVRAAWTSLVAAERVLDITVREFPHNPHAIEQAGWPEDDSVLVVVWGAVRSFRAAVRADVGNHR